MTYCNQKAIQLDVSFLQAGNGWRMKTHSGLIPLLQVYFTVYYAGKVCVISITIFAPTSLVTTGAGSVVLCILA
jgi:hypothetical protein